jgi:hypothetical protein
LQGSRRVLPFCDGGRYTVEQSGDLGNWSNAITNIPGAAFFTGQNVNAPGTQGFYKVRLDSVDAHDTVNTS